MRQIVRHPYIHAIAVGTAYSAVDLLLTLDGTEWDGPPVIAVAVSAVISAVLIVAGLQWRNVIVGRGIEIAGQLLLAATWAANVVVLWHITGGGWRTSMVLPTLLCAAALIRTYSLQHRTSRDKRDLGISTGLGAGAAPGGVTNGAD